MSAHPNDAPWKEALTQAARDGIWKQAILQAIVAMKPTATFPIPPPTKHGPEHDVWIADLAIWRAAERVGKLLDADLAALDSGTHVLIEAKDLERLKAIEDADREERLASVEAKIAEVCKWGATRNPWENLRSIQLKIDEGINGTLRAEQERDAARAALRDIFNEGCPDAAYHANEATDSKTIIAAFDKLHAKNVELADKLAALRAAPAASVDVEKLATFDVDEHLVWTRDGMQNDRVDIEATNEKIRAHLSPEIIRAHTKQGDAGTSLSSEAGRTHKTDEPSSHRETAASRGAAVEADPQSASPSPRGSGGNAAGMSDEEIAMLAVNARNKTDDGWLTWDQINITRRADHITFLKFARSLLAQQRREISGEELYAIIRASFPTNMVPWRELSDAVRDSYNRAAAALTARVSAGAQP